MAVWSADCDNRSEDHDVDQICRQCALKTVKSWSHCKAMAIQYGVNTLKVWSENCERDEDSDSVD